VSDEDRGETTLRAPDPAYALESDLEAMPALRSQIRASEPHPGDLAVLPDSIRRRFWQVFENYVT
jgi:hypothetical protein